MGAKDMQRAEIQKHIDEYLAKGGQIQYCDHTHNASFKAPKKRTRKGHTEELKKYNHVNPK